MQSMSKNEKILAMLAGVVGIVFLAWQGYGWYESALEQKSAQLGVARQEINKKNAAVARARKSLDRLAEWKRRSLSSDVDVARSSYQQWLVELADETKLSDAHVEVGRVSTAARTLKNRKRAVVYYKLPYTVSGRGTVDQAVEFLYAFHQLDHLHQIQRLTVQPLDNSKQLDLVFSIEALALPKGNSSGTLHEDSAGLLALAGMDDYQQSIGKRNVFAQYV
ncbi:MAG: hypothetical protein N2C14_33705, partial [Planctomycetales bacterium]